MRARSVNESLDFERKKDPIDSMVIGMGSLRWSHVFEQIINLLGFRLDINNFFHHNRYDLFSKNNLTGSPNYCIYANKFHWVGLGEIDDHPFNIIRSLIKNANKHEIKSLRFSIKEENIPIIEDIIKSYGY